MKGLNVLSIQQPHREEGSCGQVADRSRHRGYPMPKVLCRVQTELMDWKSGLLLPRLQT